MPHIAKVKHEQIHVVDLSFSVLGESPIARRLSMIRGLLLFSDRALSAVKIFLMNGHCGRYSSLTETQPPLNDLHIAIPFLMCAEVRRDTLCSSHVFREWIVRRRENKREMERKSSKFSVFGSRGCLKKASGAQKRVISSE